MSGRVRALEMAGGLRSSASYSYSYFLLILKNVGLNDDQWFTTVE